MRLLISLLLSKLLFGLQQTACVGFGFGIGGSFVLAIGLGMCGLALLRFLQTETGTWFTGNLNWVPYVVTFIALTSVIVVAILAVKKDAAR